MNRSDPTTRDERLQEVLLHYFEAAERGIRPDSAELVARHPDLAPDLSEFLQTQHRLEDLTAPVRQVSAALAQAARSGWSLAPGGGSAASGQVVAGRKVGEYELIDEIGRGGMGVVYKARDRRLGRLVAVKMIRSAALASPAEVERFLAEARAKARLDHPNLVPIFEVGEADGLPYFVMALVDGGSLQQRLAAGPLPAREAAEVVRQVGLGIEHAHGRGVLHRDLKPQNILLQTKGDSHAGGEPGSTPTRWVPKVSDFGLARLVDQEGQTATGEILGTPGYMPPEQAAGRAKDVSRRSDVYSLGAVLYGLLTGRPPFQAATVLETIRLVQEQDPVPPRRLNPSTPRDLEAVCLKCLEKEPGARYARAADLVADLQRFLDGKPTLARRAGRMGRALRWARRRPALAAMSAASTAALLALVAGATAYTLELRSHNAELADARGMEQWQRQAEARGRLLQRKAYADGIWRAGEDWENLRRQIEDQNSGRPVPDVLGDLPGPDEYMLPSPPGQASEDLRGFEWYYLRRAGSGLRVWRGHRDDPPGVAFSRDGRLAATAGAGDGTARVWDARTGKEIGRYPGRGWVCAAGLSPDGCLLALAGCAKEPDLHPEERGDLQVLDRLTGARVADPALGAWAVRAVAFAPDGGSLAAAGDCPDGAGVIGVWDAGSWRERFRWRNAPTGAALAFSPDGRYLAEAGQPTVTGTPAIRIHDLHSNQVRTLSPRPLEVVSRLAFAPDGRLLASGSVQGRLVLWDVASGSPHREWGLTGMAVSGLAFSPDGQTLATAGMTPKGVQPMRGLVQLWDVLTGRPRSGTWGPGGLIHNLAYSPDGRSVAVACGDATIRVWDPDRLTDSRELPASHKEAWAVAYSPDGRTLVTGGDDDRIRMWDADSGGLRATLRGHTALVSTVAFHPTGKFFASGSYDKQLRLWDTASGAPLGAPVDGHTAPVRCLAFAPDGHTVASGGRDRGILLWDVVVAADGRISLGRRAQLPAHNADVLSVAFSPDGRLLASSSDDRTVRVWDALTGEPIRTVGEQPGPVRAVAFAPDGRLAWGTDEGEVRITAATGLAPVAVLSGHAGKVRTIAFSADGRTLASAGDDQSVRLWQAATGQPLLALRGHKKAIYAVSFAPDGRSLATACYDGTVRVWRGDSAGSEPE